MFPVGTMHAAVFGTRFVAWESNATYRPPALIVESLLWPLAGVPSSVTVMRVVAGVHPAGAPMHVSRS